MVILVHTTSTSHSHTIQNTRVQPTRASQCPWLVLSEHSIKRQMRMKRCMYLKFRIHLQQQQQQQQPSHTAAPLLYVYTYAYIWLLCIGACALDIEKRKKAHARTSAATAEKRNNLQINAGCVCVAQCANEPQEKIIDQTDDLKQQARVLWNR